MFEGNGGDSYILWASDLSQPYLKLKARVMEVTYIVLQTAAVLGLECLSKNCTRSPFCPAWPDVFTNVAALGKSFLFLSSWCHPTLMLGSALEMSESL